MATPTRLISSFARRRPGTSAIIGSSLAIATGAAFTEWQATQNSALELPRRYDLNAIQQYWWNRPISTMSRFVHIFCELGPIGMNYLLNFTVTSPSSEMDAISRQQNIAKELKIALTNLGPAFVKAGQQLSIRPDLVPPTVLKELSTLCDAVRPVPDEVAFDMIRESLDQSDLGDIFDSMDLLASASLGQVYQCRLKEGGDLVAVKVQRPDMISLFSRDLVLLHAFGCLVDTFTTVFTNQPPFHSELYSSFAEGSYMELDYENEASNQIEFERELSERNCPVVIPKVYARFSSRKVLTTEWIDGIKLSEASPEEIHRLIPVGVDLFLTQLLDIGKMHCDPHQGNLLVTKEGKLCLLDFGLCAEVDEKSRNAMTKAIVHLLARDFDRLVKEDAKELGFLPLDLDTTELQPILTKILTTGLMESGSNLQNRKRKLLEISNELNQVFFQYPFSVPPFFALITRGLGLLEGIALTGDPDFDIFRASAPFARKQALKLLGSRWSRKRIISDT